MYPGLLSAGIKIEAIHRDLQGDFGPSVNLLLRMIVYCFSK